MRHKAENAEPVVKRHHDRVTTSHQMRKRIERARAANEGTPVNPGDDRALLRRGLRRLRRRDVQKKTVFVIAGLGQAVARDLRAAIAECCRVERLRPGLGGCGSAQRKSPVGGAA